MKKTFLIVAAFVSFTAFAFAGGDKNQNQHDGELGQGPTQQERIANPNKDALQVRLLTKEQKEIIYRIYEEEKVARDVYITLGKLYPEENTFANIQLSEQTHMDAVRNLCVKYGIDIPYSNEEIGEFFYISDMKSLYDNFVGYEEISLLDALLIGQEIEEMEISDLKDASADMPIDVVDVVTVFNNLIFGSINHLEAFTNAIERENLQ